jgi:hypothetical protein
VSPSFEVTHDVTTIIAIIATITNVTIPTSVETGGVCYCKWVITDIRIAVPGLGSTLTRFELA